jgi:hypothetical protein
MNKILFVIFFSVLFGCEEKETKMTDFTILNNCAFAIEVHSSALVMYNDGYKEESLIDVIQSGQLLSIRKLRVTENVSINAVFTALDIYKGSTKSTFNTMDKSKWSRTVNSQGLDEYRLIVDDTFF